jgi:hypothetical protein
MRILPILSIAFGGACLHHSGDDSQTVNCSTITKDVDGSPIDTFVVGLEKTGDHGTVDFKLISVDPAPPARGDNTWTVQINAMSSGVVGNPLNGATLAATPFMLQHAHGTPKDVIITAMTAAGQYQLKPVNMWMPGVWRTTIQVMTPAADQAEFRFCIPE